MLNQLHLALKFMMETEMNAELPFMDVLVRRENNTFVRSLYLEPNIHWPISKMGFVLHNKYKISPIRPLASRTLKISSQSVLGAEFNKLTAIFQDNGYPTSVV